MQPHPSLPAIGHYRARADAPLPVPAQNRVRRKETAHLLERLGADGLGFRSQTMSLAVGESAEGASVGVPKFREKNSKLGISQEPRNFLSF